MCVLWYNVESSHTRTSAGIISSSTCVIYTVKFDRVRPSLFAAAAVAVVVGNVLVCLHMISVTRRLPRRCVDNGPVCCALTLTFRRCGMKL